MNVRTRSLLVQVGSFALAGVLLYLALRVVDFNGVGNALREADYRWIAPLAIIILVSHLLRAWRWKVLLDALPASAPTAGPRNVSVKTAFYSVMIGYMVNYAAPRLGEVARTATLAAQEKLPFSGVLGTVVVERILDVLVLLLGLVSVFLLLLDQWAILNNLFLAPALSRLEQIPLFVLSGLLLGSTLLLLVLYRSLVHRENGRLRQFWVRRLHPIWRSFKEGLVTVLQSPRRLFLVGSTLAMWGCYLFLAYLPFLMFNMAAPFSLSILDAWSIMLLGAIGVALPSPGGIGSYHYITIQTLTVLYGVTQTDAATYAIFVHGGQMVFYIAIGFLCLVLQGSSLRTLHRRTQTVHKE